jgi:hypothetical protein
MSIKKIFLNLFIWFVDEGKSMEIYCSWCLTSLWTTEKSFQSSICKHWWLSRSTSRCKETKFYSWKSSTSTNSHIITNQRCISFNKTKWNNYCLKKKLDFLWFDPFQWCISTYICLRLIVKFCGLCFSCDHN